MTKKILFIVPYPYNVAPSQRLKFEQYYAEFDKAGYHVTYNSFISLRFWNIVYKNGRYLSKIIYTVISYFKRYFLLGTVNKYDIVYIHLWGTPLGLPIFEWMLCRLSKRIIYDIDDLVFLKDIKHENKILAFLKGKGKPIYLMRNADHVITCTPYLDQIAKKYNKHTTDISSTINTDAYIPVNSYNNNDRLVIGWSGSHSTSQYLYLLKDVLLELQKTIPFKLLVMGDTSFYIPGLDMEAIAWTEEEEIKTLQKIDIGVYPLPQNEEWVLGKSGLKALQYMSLGIPTVATNVGCNDRVIENGVDGYLVLSAQEWLDRLMALCRDPALRRAIGQRARLKVEKQFSVKNTAHVYLGIFDNL
ncbi:hypothetical protein BEL04_07090 [Mucilaginibacter sp. PPCGB 2223]|uniref:glycosyltransferase family 4 protein n=1 Tax=Mucilaginibacter sp. PPCGB 2223 TaxID=1886027 RepID=UPI000825E075|nr:glycosyltransferase family 4 protein [Mucilaginibacter sp. PPCGB 2223]OCX54032.1 hypothetical protein BEL04_07090 [Mucilaginibacter sp. PPCGB 2223]